LSDQQRIPDSPADQESFGYDDVIRSLMAACPAYEGSPERAAVDDGDGEYVRLTGFVRYLIRLLDQGDTDSLPGVFDVVERVLSSGEGPAADLIRAGFLDDLADDILYEGHHVRPVDFGPWLGPEARRDPTIQALFRRDDG
jgi:hypothetical protein